MTSAGIKPERLREKAAPSPGPQAARREQRHRATSATAGTRLAVRGSRDQAVRAVPAVATAFAGALAVDRATGAVSRSESTAPPRRSHPAG